MALDRLLDLKDEDSQASIAQDILLQVLRGSSCFTEMLTSQELSTG